jgi:hypothetical protein
MAEPVTTIIDALARTRDLRARTIADQERWTSLGWAWRETGLLGELDALILTLETKLAEHTKHHTGGTC